MNCYQCGNRLSGEDFCTSCGADVGVYKKILAMSNYYYNDGLARANVRDLSGAVLSLKQSLRYNKRNTEARNLLGLVYFEMGEAVLALSEWIISKNLQPSRNIADEYISALHSSPTKLDNIDQTLKKYNQALQYCYQDSKDLAIIQLKKVLSINRNLISGYQLLGLLYICTGDYDNAKRTLFKALSIDAGNTTVLGYIKEVNDLIREQEEKTGKKVSTLPMETISYQNGNEVIIQPVFQKEKVGFSSIINIVIGLVVGVAICWFLIMPARMAGVTQTNDEKFKEVSEQLAAEQAASQETAKLLEDKQNQMDDLQRKYDDITGASGRKTELDYLMTAASAYVTDPTDSITIMENMDHITEGYLNEAATESFRTLYDKLKEDVGTLAADEYIENAKAAVKANDYDTAIEEYTKAWLLDKTNSDVLMNLAHCYRQSGDTGKADELYQQVIDTFPDTQNAMDAADYITEER
ncbi:MAG: tetratricopeptide repeat protein [Lachnospiraceae bacterium]|nr:tetratricopeptide repeat protein [Lachnospiraceae bacterium]